MTRWYIAGLSIVAVGAAISWSQQSTAPKTAVTVDTEDREQIDRLVRELAKVRSEVRQIAQAGATASDASIAAPEKVSADEVASPKPTRPEPTEEEMFGNLDDEFHRQTYDPSWSRQATSIAGDQIASTLPPGSRIVSLECKSSICRGETVHSNMETYRAFMHDLGTTRERKWQGGSVVMLLDESGTGQVRSAVYFAKPGQDLMAFALEPEDGT